MLTIVSSVSAIAFVRECEFRVCKKHDSSGSGGSSDGSSGGTTTGGSDNSNRGDGYSNTPLPPPPPPPSTQQTTPPQTLTQQTCPDGSARGANGLCSTPDPVVYVLPDGSCPEGYIRVNEVCSLLGIVSTTTYLVKFHSK